MGDRLLPLWNFDDLDVSEQRLRTLLEQEASDAGRAEVLTQLARVQGLRRRFDEGDRLLDEARGLAASNPVVDARIRLEGGRLRRSSGEVVASLPLFESAFATALEAGEPFVAADAAHMAALAAPDRAGILAWTQRGIDLAEAEPEASHWLGPLLNNLGWEFYGAGDYEPALVAFRRALHARERDREHPREIEIARYAVGKTLRALGRPDEAAALLEQSVAWTEAAGEPDAWFHEELAEAYAALGRVAETRQQAKLALALLDAEPDAERAARLRRLASGPCD